VTSVRTTERSAWEEHPNIDGPAGTLLAVHDQFRNAAKQMGAFISREPADLAFLRRAFAPFAQTLHHHHHAEEAMLFPMVKKRTKTEPTQLVDDHQELTRAIDAVQAALSAGDRAKAPAAIKAFDEILVAHLDREEALVIPVLLEMTAAEAWSHFT
jgi:hemerythrin-like domain-containing protein